MSVPSQEARWQLAVSFAARRHQGQFRKDGVTPYIAHPLRVALIVERLFQVDDETALLAALLHDLIEDTTTDYDDLAERFGPSVAKAVAALTKDARLPEAEREAAYDRGLAQASWQARVVKLGDVYDNYCDCPSEAGREKARQKALRALACSGAEPQLERARQVVRQLIGV